jgi:hypothetical protein
MSLLVAGIQPGYLPWLGFFDQMRRADVFIVADEMPFSTDGWAHRNRVRGPHGPHWLTVPTERASRTSIRDVRVAPGAAWRRRHLTSLRHFYAASPHANEVLPLLAEVLAVECERLVEVSIPLLRLLARLLGIETPIVVSSEAGLEARFREERGPDGDATDRVISYVTAVGGGALLEGETGASYLDVDRCRERGVGVHFHRYAHPLWRQLHEGFVSHLSAIDLLLCTGPAEAAHVLRSVP